jgi:putative DNA primase/helicase
MARSEQFVPSKMWDADPDVVVCANGDLHLPSRTLNPHDPRTYATQRLPYAYDPGADCEVWENFVRNTLPEETEFLQEFAGYCLTTDTALEMALWMQGTRGSGKSTFLEGLLAMLGHRAGRLGLRDIEQSRFGLTGIQGKTLLVASEQPNLYLQSTDILDALISGEPVTVDRKYREPQTIRPVAKIVWAMNDLPRIGNSTSGIFRRVKVVRFPDPTGNPNPMVKEIIKTEGAGILNWALDGLNRLQNRGSILVPGSVAAATQEFQDQNDVPALYVAENCTVGPNESVRAGDLYADYKLWCESNGHKPLFSTRMAGEWQRLGFRKAKDNKGTYYAGVSLV